jgi:hypothetical protein
MTNKKLLAEIKQKLGMINDLEKLKLEKWEMDLGEKILGGEDVEIPGYTEEDRSDLIKRVWQMSLTRQARSYLTICSMAEMLSRHIIGRISMEVHRAEKANRPIVCILVSKRSLSDLEISGKNLGWTQTEMSGTTKTFMGYEILVEPKFPDGEYMVVTI